MSDAHEDTKARRDKEEESRTVVNCVCQLHKELGPELLETVYEVERTRMLERRGLTVCRQVRFLSPSWLRVFV